MHMFACSHFDEACILTRSRQLHAQQKLAEQKLGGMPMTATQGSCSPGRASATALDQVYVVG